MTTNYMQKHKKRYYIYILILYIYVIYIYIYIYIYINQYLLHSFSKFVSVMANASLFKKTAVVIF